MSKNHNVRLTNAATMLLLSALSNNKPGWAKEISDIAVASKLLVSTFEKFAPKYAKKSVPDEKGGTVVIDQLDLAWTRKSAEWTLTEKEREKCKHCLKTLTEGGAIPVGRPALELINVFGLDSD